MRKTKWRKAIGASALALSLAALSAEAAAQDAGQNAAGTAGLGLRRGPSGPSDASIGAAAAGALRKGTDVRPNTPVANGSDYDPYSRGSEDDSDRPDDFDSFPGDEPDPEAAVAPKRKLDLFVGPDGRPAGTDNVAAAPGGAENQGPRAGSGALRGSAAGDDSPRATNDPLRAAIAGGAAQTDLAVPATRVRTQRIDTALGRQNLAITPLRGTIAIAPGDPFAPVGTRLGSFVLYSTLEQGFGASSNLSSSAGGKSGVFSDTILSGRLLSDWSENEVELNALAAYRRNFAGSLKEEPRLSIDGRYRLDIDRLTTATLRGAFDYAKEDPSDLASGVSAADRADLFTSSAGAGITRQFGRTSLGLDGSILRSETARDAVAGATARLGEDYTTSTLSLRAGYEISPALKPFVQGSLGLRHYDDETDLAGQDRDSTIETLQAGLAFDLGEKFLGEIAAGYAWNVPDAARVKTTSAPTVAASIAWSPQRGTNVALTAGSTFDPDTDGTGTSTLYEGALSFRHRLTHRTDVNATLSAAYRDSDVETEEETSYAAEAGFTYWLNRTLALTGLVRHESLDAKGTGDYTAETARVGLKLQR